MSDQDSIPFTTSIAEDIETDETRFQEENKQPPSQARRFAGADELRRSIFFQHLDSAILDAVWGAGSQKMAGPGRELTIRSESVEFLNIVLDGKMDVVRLSPAQNRIKRSIGVGQMFGPIDTVIGTGRFIAAKALTPVKLFCLTNLGFQKLLAEHPDLNTHLSQTRVAFAIHVASEYQKRLQTHEALASGGEVPPEVRVAPRFSVVGKKLNVRLSEDDIREIDNISATGLFVYGAPPDEIGKPLEFQIKGSAAELQGINLKGIIARKATDGFGIHLSTLEGDAQATWNALVTSAMSLEITQTSRPKLEKLNIPLNVSYNAGGSISDGKILALSHQGAVLSTTKPVATDKIIIFFPYTPTGEAQNIPLGIQSFPIGRKENRYLLRFETLDIKKEAAVSEILSKHVIPTEKPEKTSGTKETSTQKPTKPKVIPAPPKEERNISEHKKEYEKLITSSQEFYRFFFRELQNQIILVKGEYSVGEQVKIHLILPYDVIPVAKSRSHFRLIGSVNRCYQNGAVIGLDSSAIPVIMELRGVADMASRYRTKSAVKQAATTEHNLKFRRDIQFILISILLGACICWAVVAAF